jgi:hypothetical protein
MRVVSEIVAEGVVWLEFCNHVITQLYLNGIFSHGMYDAKVFRNVMNCGLKRKILWLDDVSTPLFDCA